jgi:hypothetical protein
MADEAPSTVRQQLTQEFEELAARLKEQNDKAQELFKAANPALSNSDYQAAKKTAENLQKLYGMVINSAQNINQLNTILDQTPQPTGKTFTDATLSIRKTAFFATNLVSLSTLVMASFKQLNEVITALKTLPDVTGTLSADMAEHYVSCLQTFQKLQSIGDVQLDKIPSAIRSLIDKQAGNIKYLQSLADLDIESNLPLLKARAHIERAQFILENTATTTSTVSPESLKVEISTNEDLQQEQVPYLAAQNEKVAIATNEALTEDSNIPLAIATLVHPTDENTPAFHIDQSKVEPVTGVQTSAIPITGDSSDDEALLEVRASIVIPTSAIDHTDALDKPLSNLSTQIADLQQQQELYLAEQQEIAATLQHFKQQSTALHKLHPEIWQREQQCQLLLKMLDHIDPALQSSTSLLTLLNDVTGQEAKSLTESLQHEYFAQFSGDFKNEMEAYDQEDNQEALLYLQDGLVRELVDLKSSDEYQQQAELITVTDSSINTLSQKHQENQQHLETLEKELAQLKSEQEIEQLFTQKLEKNA